MKTKIHSLAGIGIFLVSVIIFFPSTVSAATVVSGSISEDIVWTTEYSPYVVNGTLSIPVGLNLMIEPGVVVKFIHNQSKLDVYGSLQVNGTNENKVYFTSYKDDTVGGDTNGDGDVSVPAPKDWRQIIIYPGGDASFDNTVIRYGGNTAFSCPNSDCFGAVNNRGNLNFANSQISQTDKFGIYQTAGVTNVSTSIVDGHLQGGINILDGELVVSNSTISNQYHTGIVMSGSGNFSLNNNTFQNNLRDVYVSASANFTHADNISEGGTGRGFHISGTTDINSVWTKDNMPYIVDGIVTVPVGSTLAIHPGTIIKFRHNQSGINVSGTLNVQGEAENKVYFTSYKDDTVGGDTNGDNGASLPIENDWRRLLLNSGSTANIDNAVIRYGGYIQFSCPNFTCFGVVNNKGNLNLSNSEITKNGTYGIYQNEGVSNIDATIVSWHSRGIYLGSGNSNLSIHNSSILDNNYFGILNNSTNTVDATNNWWGDATGPNNTVANPAGLGNPVSNNVSFEPWLNSAPGTIDPLILQYEPILYFHEKENFYPMNVEAFVNNSSLWRLDGSHQLIKDESDITPVTLADLTPDGQETANFYLQFSEDLADKQPDPNKARIEYQELMSSGQAHNTYYAYKSEDYYIDDEGVKHDFIVLQYWYFYAFNDWKAHGGLNNHEGDWEVVVVFLDKDSEEPQYVAYSAHHNEGVESVDILQYDSVRRSWTSNEINKEGNNIISFVAVGSHANYPNNGDTGKHKVPPIHNDLTSYGGNHLYNENWQEKFIFNESDLPLWLTGYEGLWGVNNVKDKGPQGPYYRTGEFGDKINLFYNPIEWAGIDNVGQKTVTEATKLLNLVTQGTKFVFDNVLEIGTTIAVDLHDEAITFGNNISDIIFSPHFWDIESSLENNTFGVEVSFDYDAEELTDWGINENYLSVFYYNDITKIWETVPSVVDINNSSVSFFTNHFSRYAIGVEVWQDITDDVRVLQTNQHYDQQTGIKSVKVKLKNNTEENISGNLRLLITDIDQEEVEFVNPTGTTTDGIPYIDIGQPYNQCVFVGSEEDLSSIENKSLNKKLLKEKIMNKNQCEKITKKYPQLTDKLEYILAPYHYTEPVELQFSLPIKKVKVIESKKGEKTKYIPEFKKFDFGVMVLNAN